jgi:Tol biopolymer transport system component
MTFVLGSGVLLAQKPPNDQQLPAPQSSKPSPSQNGTIVYEHTTLAAGDDYHPTNDIYSVSADGTNIKALTNDGNSHSPSWSPDGRQIFFIQDGRTQRMNRFHQSHLPFGLYVMNRDGSDVHLVRSLSVAGGYLSEAKWSPDSKLIVEEIISPPEPRPNLFLLPANGQGEARLLVRFGVRPSWSPDGQKIVFSQQGAIKVIGADGSGLVSLTDPMLADSPAWSPDEKQIAFAAIVHSSLPWPNNRDSNQIFVMDSDGSHSRQLTTNPDWSCLSLSWSPDGQRVTFSCRYLCITFSVGPPPGLPFPPCSQRIFVVSTDAPLSKLTPLIDDDAEASVFAPSN